MSETQMVRGRVVDHKGTPCGGATIFLQSASGLHAVFLPEQFDSPGEGSLVQIKVQEANHASGSDDCEQRAKSEPKPLVALSLQVMASVQNGLPNPASDWAHLRQQGTLTNLKRKAKLLRTIRHFFESEGFTEVETPILVRSPGVEVHLPAVSCHTAGGERFLITSPEFHMKRLIGAGMERIFQLTRSFRDGELGVRHNSEFTILEWYRAYNDHLAIMDDCEALLVEGAHALTGSGEKITYGGQVVRLDRPFPRFTLDEAFKRFAHKSLEALINSGGDWEERFYRDLIDHIEPALARLGQPAFLVDWPAPMASLGKVRQAEPFPVAERFELYAGGLELANGFSELLDFQMCKTRMEGDLAQRRRMGYPLYPLDEAYLKALADGVPPTGGVAVGVDRLAMLLFNCNSIHSVIPFPFERT